MKLKLLATVLAVGLASVSEASLAVGVDTFLGSFGSYTTSGGSVAAVLTDSDKGTYAFSFTTGAYADLGWSSVVATNDAGNDIELFELGIPDYLKVTINGITNTYLTTYTGMSAGVFNLNSVAIDLSSFGVASGDGISSLRVGLDYYNQGTVPSLSYVDALHSSSVPEPGTYGIMLAGIGLLGFAARRRKQ